MKTLTEFAASTLKNALDKKNELTAAGKTAEELPAALGEALKIEGDKLTYMLAALELVGDKSKDLKRVLVSALSEGENAPSSARLIGDKYYSVENYVSMRQQAPAPQDDRKGGGKRGDKRGGGRGGDRGGDRGGRGPGGGGPGGARGPGGNDRGAGGGGGRGPRPVTAGTGKLPVPNKVATPTPKAEDSQS